MPNYKVIDADKFDADLKTLADGIRAKITNKAPLRFPDEMAEAIRDRGAKCIPKTFTEDGVYDAAVDGADGYNPVTVKPYSNLEYFFDGTATELDLPRITKIRGVNGERIFFDSGVKKVTAPNVTEVGIMAFYGCSTLETIDMPKLERIESSAFASTKIQLDALPPNLKYIGSNAFKSCSGVIASEFPASIEYISDNPFSYSNPTLTFKGTPKSGMSSSAFSSISSIVTIINVPWEEGEVSGAPWGATNATINYGYFGADVPLAGTWRLKDEFEPLLAGDYDVYIRLPFASGGKRFDYINFFYGEIYFGTDDGETNETVYGTIYNEDTEEEYYGFNENYRTFTVDEGTEWNDVEGYNQDTGEDIRPSVFGIWLLEYAEKQ